MAYNFISSQIFIARLEINFNVSYSNHHALVAEYVAQAIGLLKIPIMLTEGRACLTVTSGRAKLPCNLKLIRAISYKGKRIEDLSSLINSASQCDILPNTIPYYTTLRNGWISTSFDECEPEDLVCYYTQLATEYDPDNRVYYPLIPDAEGLLDAIDYFIMKRLLERGYTHPSMSLSSNNPLTNPGLAWETKKKQARLSVSTIDPNVRHQISIILKALVVNPNAYYNQFFNPTK